MCHFLTLLKVLVLLILFTYISQNIIAQESDSRIKEPIIIKRINSPVTLDGLSNEPAWEGIEPFHLMMRIPTYGNEPTEHTEIRMGYDQNYIYIAGRLYDRESSKIQAISFKRDGGFSWGSDVLGVLFDTFNDNENAVLFLTTPLGTRTDVNIKNDAAGSYLQYTNLSWNAFWDVATVRNENGWFAEFRIPFSSLQFEDKDGQTVMGFTTYRIIRRKSEVDIFPKIPQKRHTFSASQSQKIIFKGIKRQHPIYITPYLLGGIGYTNDLNENNTAYKKNEEDVLEAGLDVKYGLTDNLTLDVTVNPDFAQVEADDQVINLTRFSLFFPEKRLFFQERQGNFDFRFDDSNRLFYSRQIGINRGKQVRIYGGARVVGRTGPWDIGFLNMQTEKFENLPSQNFNVLRLRKQVLNPNSYIGGIFTSRIGNSNNWNTAYGIDGIFRLLGDEYLIVKWAQSFQNDNENQVGSLQPSKIYVNWDRRKLEGLGYTFSFSRTGSDFNPGIGYEQRNNYTRFGDRIQYIWFPAETSILQNHGIFLQGVLYMRNTDSEVESSVLNSGWQFATKEGSTGSFAFKHFKEDVAASFSIASDTEVPAGMYSFSGLQLNYNWLRKNPYNFGANIYAGSFYDGQRVSVRLTPVANISAYLQLTATYQMDKIDFPDRDQKFTGHIGRLKLSAFLNSKISLISFAQYNSAIEKIITNLRFRYNPSEGHDLYLVYDEGLNTDRQRIIPKLPYTSNRTVMLKYSYTFVAGG